ncbi:hypothetical protein [Pseudomonas sp. BGI-2]|uniref:hypothetical protein n=1 Tax=Pseudomonas sp. BGI-2 TaxID=2528211 RepID=UPI0010344D38|nr:hypothetical protein [Pseudomonas sp. BGI-2]TBN45904.1 hypothetical protein EYC95_13355 [Pseudomonas sp. BGI-2]
MLFVIGVLLIVAIALALLFIEAKRAKAKIAATLETSVARHKVLLQEQRAEIGIIEQKHQEKLAVVAKAHHNEMEALRGILAISDQDRDEALNTTSRAQRHVDMLQEKVDHFSTLMSSWAVGNDETATAVMHALRADHATAKEQTRWGLPSNG